jgi:hypothetical protein
MRRRTGRGVLEALQSLQGFSFGWIVLLVIALGLVAFGITAWPRPDTGTFRQPDAGKGSGSDQE